MNNIELIEKLCQIIEECLDLIEDEALQREMESEYEKAMGERYD